LVWWSGGGIRAIWCKIGGCTSLAPCGGRWHPRSRGAGEGGFATHGGVDDGGDGGVDGGLGEVHGGLVPPVVDVHRLPDGEGAEGPRIGALPERGRKGRGSEGHRGRG